jgi:hypothetical protein
MSPDQRVSATLDAYPDWHIPGRVITTVPSADRQKATVLVRIAFDALDPRILPDMGVKVAFLGTETPAGGANARPRLTVPRSAVRQESGRDVVFVVQADRAERRAVRTAALDGERAELASGLTPGERVIVDPPAELKNGSKVRVQ